MKAQKNRLLEKIIEGRKYLEKEHYAYNELIRLINQLEKKKLQFEKDLNDYTNTKEKDEDKIFEYEEVKVDGEEVCDDLLHYIDVIKQSSAEEENKKERLEEERKKEIQHQMEIERLEFEERKRKISMAEKINLEKLHIEKMKVGEEKQIAARQVSKKSVKLPKLELKKFDGSIFKWVEFWDAFESAIHSNKQLHDVDKFNYLKAQLKGTASEVISGLELTQENYNIAINLLKERYGKKQIMIKAHFAKLMNLPMATYKATSLRTFYDTMEKHLRCLQSLGEDDNNTQILTVLQSKLPRSVLLQLERIKERANELTVKKFREVLHHHISTLQACFDDNKR